MIREFNEIINNWREPEIKLYVEYISMLYNNRNTSPSDWVIPLYVIPSNISKDKKEFFIDLIFSFVGEILIFYMCVDYATIYEDNTFNDDRDHIKLFNNIFIYLMKKYKFDKTPEFFIDTTISELKNKIQLIRQESSFIHNSNIIIKTKQLNKEPINDNERNVLEIFKNTNYYILDSRLELKIKNLKNIREQLKNS